MAADPPRKRVNAAPFEMTDRPLGEDSHVLELIGQVDLYTAPAFKERMAQLIEKGNMRIVVDLTRVSFMDSTALGVLVGGLKRLRPAGGSIAVVCADEQVIRLFELTGLDHTFDIHETLEQAAAGARGGSS
jgi:anti-sigma B factor antagonist